MDTPYSPDDFHNPDPDLGEEEELEADGLPPLTKEAEEFADRQRKIAAAWPDSSNMTYEEKVAETQANTDPVLTRRQFLGLDPLPEWANNEKEVKELQELGRRFREQCPDTTVGK